LAVFSPGGASLYFATVLWHISLTASCVGTGAGLKFGCMMNLLNVYIMAKYPNQIATSKSVYFKGGTVGQIISAPVMVAVYETDSTPA